jgi:hypothetical protein
MLGSVGPTPVTCTHAGDLLIKKLFPRHDVPTSFSSFGTVENFKNETGPFCEYHIDNMPGSWASLYKPCQARGWIINMAANQEFFTT